jgi:hypothetical protein
MRAWFIIGALVVAVLGVWYVAEEIDDDPSLGDLIEAFDPTPCPSDEIAFVIHRGDVQTIFIDGALTYTADRGEKWLVIDVEIENPGDTPFKIAEADFDLLDSNDRPYEWTILGFDSTEELDGTVNPGESLRGKKAFSVPASIDEATLVYDNDCIERRWELRLGEFSAEAID